MQHAADGSSDDRKAHWASPTATVVGTVLIDVGSINLKRL
jgi:hypothetical protein